MSSASVSAPAAQRVALLGFGDFERSALVSYLRLSGSRVPAYQEAPSLASADFVIADADHAGTLDAVLGADRVADTVFIGSLAPDGALAWMMRPIDPLQVFREIDATVALRRARAMPASPAPVRAAPAVAPRAAPAPSTAPAPPAAAATTAAATKPAERSTARRAGDVIAPISALLVDDGELTLRALERQLNALGLRTETAAHSQAALELLSLRHFDLVFLDDDLGPHSRLDGLALCQQIKRRQRRTAPTGPLVVLTSNHAAATDRVRGSFAGCDGYLNKPIDDDALRRCLRALGLRLASSADSGNSRPGALSTRSMPLDRSS
jgi:CheY-like chemotaxis protein